MGSIEANFHRLARAVRGHGYLHTGAKVLRSAVFPKGSRRDKLWAYWLRPVVLLAMGRPPPTELPTAELRTWSGPANRLFGVQQEMRSILVLKVDHIGDFLLAMPALALLRRNFPDARISLLCGKWNAGLAEKTGLFDAVIPFEFFPGNADAQRRGRDPRELEELGLPMFDLAIDMRVDEDARVLLRHVSARCKAGYYSRLMPSDMAIVLPPPPLEPPDRAGILPHQRHLMLRLVASVIAYLDPLHDSCNLIERVVAEHEASVTAMRARWTGPVVVVNTSSGREIKNWSLENFVTICRWLLRELDATVVLIGGPAQKRDSAQIMRKLRDARLINLVGQIPIEKAIAVIKHSDLFLGNDSGPTHAAAMLNVPTVALYSGIDPIATWGPLGPKVTAIKAQVPCSPCHLTHITDCSNAHVCMRSIAPDTVKQAILRFLLPGQAALPAPADAGEEQHVPADMLTRLQAAE
ncbi:MAG: glycosyltransferase family 9 protein [Acidisphaera sp.]|nr:glycosyltransferase family 9 protein [Acidisphaera sp.]